MGRAQRSALGFGHIGSQNTAAVKPEKVRSARYKGSALAEPQAWLCITPATPAAERDRWPQSGSHRPPSGAPSRPSPALNASETVSASNVRRDGECLPPVTRVVSYVHSACNKPNSNEPAGIPDQNGKRSVSRSSAFKTEPRDRVRALLDCGESFALAQRRMLCTLREITRKEANC